MMHGQKNIKLGRFLFTEFIIPEIKTVIFINTQLYVIRRRRYMPIVVGFVKVRPTDFILKFTCSQKQLDDKRYYSLVLKFSWCIQKSPSLDLEYFQQYVTPLLRHFRIYTSLSQVGSCSIVFRYGLCRATYFSHTPPKF